MNAPLKCACRNVRHALDTETRRRVQLKADAATLAGRDMLAGYYSQRLSACSTADPSARQLSVMAAADERAAVGA